MSHSTTTGTSDSSTAGAVGGDKDLRRPFVGRDEPVGLLLDCVQRAGGYGTRVALVLGERGVGKTRLAAEVATRAEECGARATWGRAWDGVRVRGLWPWSRALRAIAARVPRVAQRHRVVLERLEAGEVARGEPAAVPLEVCEGVVSLLGDLASRSPLLLVLDDLHVADEASLSLLQFVSRDVGHGRFIILGTCRDEEVAARPQLAMVLGSLDQRTLHLTLAPLGREAIRTYLTGAMGGQPSERLVDEVCHGTGGNAFFLDKIGVLYASTRYQQRDTAGLSMPPGVREEVIGYRTTGLSDPCRRALNAASVLGREFRVDVLARVLEMTRSSAAAPIDDTGSGALTEAFAARLLHFLAAGEGQRCAFSHGLVRDALYDQLAPVDRRRLHRLAGEALAALAADDDVAALEQVADHLERSDAQDAPAHAAVYAATAGELHERRDQHGPAARAYERALAAPEPSGTDTLEWSRRRCEWALRLAAARRRGGDREGAREAVRHAGTLARALVDRLDAASGADLLTRVATERSAGRAWSRMGIDHDEEFSLLHEALSRLPEGDSLQRARALGQLAREFWHTAMPSGLWREALSREAVAMARRTGDLDVLAHTIECQHIAGWSAESAGERLAHSAELLTLARHLPHRELRARAHLLRGLDLLETGAMIEMKRELHLCSALAREIGAELLVWHGEVVRATHAACEGRLEEAERLALQALEMGQRIRSEDAAVFFGVHLYTLRRLQGRFDELLPMAREFVDQFPTIPVWRVGLADLYALLGRQREAYEEFEYFAATDFAEPPPDWNWLLSMALLSEVCTFLADRRRAAMLYERLLPFAEQMVTAVPGLACIGPASYQLGLLATTLERWTDAATHFEAAITRNVQIGALPYAAHAQRQYAAALLRRSGASVGNAEAPRIAALLDEAEATYERLGMKRYAEHVRLLRAGTGQPGAASMSAATAPDENAFYLERKRWIVIWQGRRAEFRDLVGLRYIAYLIGRSPEPVHVAELEAGCRDRRALEASPVQRAAVRSEGLTIRSRPTSSLRSDRRARDEYAARLQAVDSELEEAKRNHDLGRISALTTERDAIKREVIGAFHLLDADDRQRKRIWRAISMTALPLIRAEVPDLADHLSSSLTTGTLCKYAPRSAVTWHIERRDPPSTRIPS